MNIKINQNFNEELMKLIDSVDDDESVCLIDGMKLDEHCVELKCTHQFNYLSLLNELKIQKKRNRLEIQSLGNYQLKCPYCRNIHNGILPYNQKLHDQKIKGINWPPSKVLKCKKCISILKSGKRKGEQCSKSCIKEYCTVHYKVHHKSHDPTCTSMLKSGKRKGEICGCKCKNGNILCGRHFSKKKY
jgi:hypothetical protein